MAATPVARTVRIPPRPAGRAAPFWSARPRRVAETVARSLARPAARAARRAIVAELGRAAASRRYGATWARASVRHSSETPAQPPCRARKTVRGVFVSANADDRSATEAALEEVQVPERVRLVLGHAGRGRRVYAAHVIAREAVVRGPADDPPLQEVVGPRPTHVGPFARPRCEVDEQLPAVQQQRPSVAPAQPSEPEAGGAGLAQTAPLLEFVVAGADDETLALARGGVDLVEIGHGRLTGTGIRHVDPLDGDAEPNRPIDVLGCGVTEETALSLLRSLQRHDHGRSRHLDVFGRRAESGGAEGLHKIAPLLPRWIDRQSHGMATARDLAKAGEGGHGRRRSCLQQYRSAGRIVDPEATERALANARPLLD